MLFSILFPLYFNRTADESKLVIRQGLTSSASALDTIQWSTKRNAVEPKLKSYIVPMSSGFYVTFKGVFDSRTRLALVYTAFSYMGKITIFVFQIFFFICDGIFCFSKSRLLCWFRVFV